MECPSLERHERQGSQERGKEVKSREACHERHHLITSSSINIIHAHHNTCLSIIIQVGGYHGPFAKTAL
jgi:hypothetical protein